MANQIVWAARSDNGSFNARYSPNGLAPGIALQSSATAAPLFEADAAAIGGNRWNMDRGSALNRILSYSAKGIFNTQTISVLMRVQIPVAGLLGIFELNGASSFGANQFTVFWSTNNWQATVKQANGLAGVNNATIVTSAPTTAVYLDIVWTWDGTTTANAFKLYVNASNIGSVTSSQAWAASKDPLLTDYLAIGGVSGVNSVRMYFNECVVWNYVINPASVQLTTGLGSLNGASRTAFVDVASFDGSINTDPGISNVRNATAYEIQGVPLTGNMVEPTAAQVQVGVTFGSNSGLTGTYNGSDRWSDPGVGNVKVGVQYKANSTTNNETGTYTGADRWSDPGQANVLSGVSYLANTVNETGTLVSTDPGVGNVRSGTSYSINSAAKTGTLGPFGSTDPGIANVRLGTVYSINGASLTGTLGPYGAVDPGIGNVRLGQVYSINGVPLTGTLGPYGSADPGVENVLDGTDYAINGENLVGELGPFGSTDPGIDNVTIGVEYDINGEDLVGTRQTVTNVLQSATLVGQDSAAILEGSDD
jgi:hypothetical protein